jgi:hypothetical protein
MSAVFYAEVGPDAALETAGDLVSVERISVWQLLSSEPGLWSP